MTQPKFVFAHYMVCNRNYGGSVAGYKRDITDAQAIGIDGFALNMGAWNSANYKQDTESMFQAAEQLAAANPALPPFLLFLSADMTGIAMPEIVEMMTAYAGRPSYYKKPVVSSTGGTDLRPFLSTWGGEGGGGTYADVQARWHAGALDPLRASGIHVFFAPRFFVHWAAADVAGLLTGFADGAFVAANLGTIPPPPGSQDVVADEAWQCWNVKQAGLYVMASVSPQYWNVKPGTAQAYYEFHGGLGMRTQWLPLIGNPNVDDVEIFTWNDFDEATYCCRVDDVCKYWPFTFITYLGFYHQRLATCEDLTWYIKAFKAGAEPAPAQDVMAYQYRLTPDAVDSVFIRTRLTAPGTVQFMSGDGKRQPVDVPAGWAHTPLPLLPGAQQFALLRGGAILAAQAGAPVTAPPYAQYNNIYFEGLMAVSDLSASASTASTASIVPADYDIMLGPPLTAIAENSAELVSGSDGYVHALLTATHSEDGTRLDLSGAALLACLVPEGTSRDPSKQTLLPASVLTRTAVPAGQYLRLAVGPDAAGAPPPGPYRLYAQIALGGETIERYAAGYVTFL